jgi:hypothetical protein
MKSDRFLYFGVISLKGWACRMVADGVWAFESSEIKIRSQSIDSFGVLMIAIKTKFVLYPHQDQDGACHANGQSDDVDYRVDFVAPNVSEGDFEVVGKHIDFGFLKVDY